MKVIFFIVIEFLIGYIFESLLKVGRSGYFFIMPFSNKLNMCLFRTLVFLISGKINGYRYVRELHSLVDYLEKDKVYKTHTHSDIINEINKCKNIKITDKVFKKSKRSFLVYLLIGKKPPKEKQKYYNIKFVVV